MMDEQQKPGPAPEPPVPMEDRDEAGTVRRRYTMQGGVLQGVMETFDANGLPESRMNFHQGKLHGASTIFQAGQPAVQMTYVNGVLDGEVRSFDPAGRLTAVTRFLGGKRSGDSQIFRPDGSLFRRETWQDDQMHGPVEEFNPDGSLLRRSTYVANMLHGEVLTYGAAGAEPERVIFDKGLAKGPLAPLAGPIAKTGLRQKLFGKKIVGQDTTEDGMGQQVVMGALLQCSMGAAPSSMMVLPANCTMACNMPAANIMDYVPMMNIMPFGTCISMANPMVAAATAAALGVLTPMPCIPMTVAPWIVGAPTVLIGNMPALNNSSKCMCAWGGSIAINFAGQATVQVP